ncbi:GNAT family N-acetyltransferase [Salinibacterium sp. NSLL150]|uniref:GNAT family N-acetyltransferase n=1 Tax=unclassified Salinibacterium TaxID=2632331 RepID=UPI0018CD1774|nr:MULTISPECIES: GNAT family N-acetyltransferase [unclassified Salinibacterium]MBH0099407.1 GNAT family N-acetyltransferase [Salinibacterium sp. NSLL35]MBH0102161.1 GNAT family N-acetyltransferase [Salinibacterium sp. NSLL150]MBH0104921.1 GNAT family N-acetyltransferase [Salinibacterium sp. NSLL16]MBH0107681.1 GNAT family N-acetyltransferase [Salinibacterium sp. NSLL17]
MPSFTTRAARLDDAKELASVHTQSWKETYTGLFPEQAWSDEARQRREAMWNELLTDANTTTVVAEVRSHIIGFAQAHHNRDDPDLPSEELAMIYVLASAHGTGAGQSLIDAALGGAAASVWVLEQNPRARAFYARNRFMYDGTVREMDFNPNIRELRLARS